MKVKFHPGKQREFIKKVLELIGCPSLRELVRRGVEVKYSSLKNYYSERRLLSLELVENLLKLSKLNPNEINFEVLPENWGQIKGGKKRKSKD